jgi:DNA-directed RNA polymerase subunit RPC12/RpoP
MEENVVKQMMTSLKCTNCGQKYQQQDIEILSCHQHLYFLQVSCSACQSRFLITAVLKNGGPPEMVTDLTAAEMEIFTESRAPGPDDLLDMHAYLKQFNGDFAALFGYKKV